LLQRLLGRFAVSDARPSFWTTVPGILTGLAALITALVGVVALVIQQHGDSPSGKTQNGPVTDQKTTATPSSTSSAGQQEGQSPVTLSVTMQPDDELDVDTGQVGTGVDGELAYRLGAWLQLLEGRAAVVPKETDQAGCASALQRRSDSGVNSDRLAAGAILCLSTDQGNLAEASFSPLDTTKVVAVDLTVWRH
jgi:hypothetical protein